MNGTMFNNNIKKYSALLIVLCGWVWLFEHKEKYCSIDSNLWKSGTMFNTKKDTTLLILLYLWVVLCLTQRKCSGHLNFTQFLCCLGYQDQILFMHKDLLDLLKVVFFVISLHLKPSLLELWCNIITI